MPKTKRKRSLMSTRRGLMFTKRRVKSPSRIPGLSVGEEAQTEDGLKKKVCFNIGRKWVFRMVDADWVPPGRPHRMVQR